MNSSPALIVPLLACIALLGYAVFIHERPDAGRGVVTTLPEAESEEPYLFDCMDEPDPALLKRMREKTLSEEDRRQIELGEIEFLERYDAKAARLAKELLEDGSLESEDSRYYWQKEKETTQAYLAELRRRSTRTHEPSCPEESASDTATDVVHTPSAPVAGFRDCPVCPELVVAPAGTFLMGAPEIETWSDDNERPQHRVTLSGALAVGRYEVTFDEWDACVAAGGCAWTPGDEGWGRGRRPVINVSWEDAQAYLRWLSSETGHDYRLPSEAEWEYVARAGTTTPYHSGEALSCEQANYLACGHGGTVPVGQYAPNAFGLHDAHGNASEWVQDCWNENYAGAPSDGSAWMSGHCSGRVLRGSSWYFKLRHLRSANRGATTVAKRSSKVGFRVARSHTR